MPVVVGGLCLSNAQPLIYMSAMKLDPQAQRIYEAYLATDPREPTVSTVPSIREVDAAEQAQPTLELPTLDTEIPGPGGTIPLRFYYPPGAATEYPALIYFHAGGFVFGSIGRDDRLCRKLAFESKACVIAVGYRLAPEARFPAAVLDAYLALSHIHENAGDYHLDYHRLAVAGSSAGAALATVIARQAKERRGPELCCQVLYCPVTDLRELDTPSYYEFADGPMVTRASMEFCRDQYLPDHASRSDPAASPLVAQNLIGMPAAYVVTAECDPLRDEGNAYAEALRTAATEVAHHCYAGQFHNFVRYVEELVVAQQVLADTGRWLRARLGS